MENILNLLNVAGPSFDKEEAVNDEFAPPHPYITNEEFLDGPAFFKVQLYIVKEHCPAALNELWPPSDVSIPHTIPAAAPTNCVIWIHAAQIQGVVFLPHADHVINQTYGNLSGRADLYYVHYYSASFGRRRNGEYEVYFTEEEHSGAKAYNMFKHPSNRPRVNGFSYSECIFESISQIARLSDSMLVKTGTINRQVTKKVAMPRESWNYMLRTLETSSQEYLEVALNHHFPFAYPRDKQSRVFGIRFEPSLPVQSQDNHRQPHPLGQQDQYCTRYAITARNVGSNGLQTERCYRCLPRCPLRW
jgi:hypothetical protein